MFFIISKSSSSTSDAYSFKYSFISFCFFPFDISLAIYSTKEIEVSLFSLFKFIGGGAACLVITYF